MEHSLVFAKAYDAYQLVASLVQDFTKKDRYSIGVRLETQFLLLIEDIVTAEVTVPALKDRALISATVRADVASVLVRLTLERKLIRETNYFLLANALTEIAKMATGWRKSLSGRKY